MNVIRDVTSRMDDPDIKEVLISNWSAKLAFCPGLMIHFMFSLIHYVDCIKSYHSCNWLYFSNRTIKIIMWFNTSHVIWLLCLSLYGVSIGLEKKV